MLLPPFAEREEENRATNTKPERILRSLLWSAGYRYRLHSSLLPGRPDLVFASRRRVIFVHGCFWHQHSRCKLARRPSTRRDYWDAKFERNKSRDRKVMASIRRAGWEALVVWECELRDGPEMVMQRVCSFLGPPKRSR
jgi:DNA mismatch endonuclease (patch repair protein)